MKTAIADLFESLQIRPVLVEIGSSQHTADIWRDIAPYSTYVAIGPDSRAVSKDSRRGFREFIPVEVAATDRPVGHAKLHVAKDPVYSSLLQANAKVLSEFFDLGCVAADHETEVTCSTVNAVIANLDITQIDWLKTNINGLDARILQNLGAGFRQRLLAVDTCLDFIDLFSGQDATLAQHPELVGEGFWLSRLLTCGGLKMRKDSLQQLQNRFSGIDRVALEGRHRVSPGWAFATYFRSVDSMMADDFTRRQYVLLWSFALLDRQFGFAADLAFAYETIFGRDAISNKMLLAAAVRLANLKPHVSPLRKAASAVIPGPLKRGLRRLIVGA